MKFLVVIVFSFFSWGNNKGVPKDKIKDFNSEFLSFAFSDKSLENTRKFYKKYPKSDVAIAMYLGSLTERKKHSEVVKISEECISLYSQSQPCFSFLIVSSKELDGLGGMKNAIDFYFKNIPTGVICLNSLAEYHEKKGNYEQSIKYYKEAVKHNGDVEGIKVSVAMVDYKIGNSYEKMGNKSKAKEYFSRSCDHGYTESCKKTSK